MITALRHFLVDSWFGRVIAFIVFASFVVLGGTFFGFGGGASGLSGDSVVQIGPHKVTPEELQQAVQRQVAFYLQQGGANLEILKSPQARQEIGRAALRNIIIAQEAELAGQRNGLTPSDDTIRNVVFSMPEFKDKDGNFDPQKMDRLLEMNRLDHQTLIKQTTRMLYAGATMFGFGQSAQAPQAEAKWMEDFFGHGHLVDVLRVPFSKGGVSTQPTDVQLQRYYKNHIWQYKVPEYRHARLVVMTAETVAATIDISDADLLSFYKENSQKYNSPELRSVEVFALSDEQSAHELAAAWRGGESWDALQKQYPKAIPASLNDARVGDLPDAVLAKTAFATPVGKVSSPVRTAAGWSVVHVLNVKPARHTSFADVKENLRKEVRQTQAGRLLKERQKAFEEAVASSVTLDKIPADLGAIPLAGSMDADGRQENGTLAPLPGGAAVREALIHQVFMQGKDDLPHVVTLPDGTAFSVLVDQIIPEQQKPYDAVAKEVATAWKADAQKKAVEERVTALYQQAKAKGLKQALQGQPEASLLRKDERFSRLQPRQDMPSLIVKAALQQDVGQVTMLQEGDSFWLVNVTGSFEESPVMLQVVQHKIAQQLSTGYRDDASATLGMSYTRAAEPRHFNAALFNQVINMTFDRISGGLAQQ